MKYFIPLALVVVILTGCDAFGSDDHENPPIIEHVEFHGVIDQYGQESVIVTVSNPQNEYYLIDEGGWDYTPIFSDTTMYEVTLGENGMASVNMLVQTKERSGFETVSSFLANRE